MSFDVEIAELIIEVRKVELLEALEATVGGRTVEPMEENEPSRLIEGDRMN